MKIRGAARTDPGRVRRENQDNFGLVTKLGLGFVADGMGGHAGGRRASEEAARVITESVTAGAACGTSPALRLLLAIEEANRQVWKLPQSEPALHGLGTTVAAQRCRTSSSPSAAVPRSKAASRSGAVTTRPCSDHRKR